MIFFLWEIFPFKLKIFCLIQEMKIKEGTAAYKAFLETPVPVLTKFYFFDMKSSSELFYRHEAPTLEERGPYTFRYDVITLTR